MAAATKAGADRLELCAALAVGGLTPGPGLITAARACSLPCHAMVRPRDGGFVATPDDVTAMRADVAAIRGAGLAGVVIGAALPDGRLDRDTLARLRDDAGPMQVTLHRVFDTTPDPFAALEVAIELGLTRILTSGQAAAAPDGVTLIARLVETARGRIQIMAGGGVTPAAVSDLMATGVDALHASCSRPRPDDGPAQRIGIQAGRDTDAATVRALRAAMLARAA